LAVLLDGVSVARIAAVCLTLRLSFDVQSLGKLAQEADLAERLPAREGGLDKFVMGALLLGVAQTFFVEKSCVGEIDIEHDGLPRLKVI
jgi:hypothetical protein